MNQDFIVKATPGNARRIVSLADKLKLHVDDDIAALAKTGLIENFPAEASDAQRAAMQYLADVEHRCILFCDDVWEGMHALLLSARCADIKPIIVLTTVNNGYERSRNSWLAKFRQFNVNPYVPNEHFSYDPSYDLFIVNNKTVYNKALLKDVRDGILILESDTFENGNTEGLFFEFVRTVVIVKKNSTRSHGRSSQWYRDKLMVNIAHHLFLDRNFANAFTENPYVLQELMSRGVLMPHPHSMADVLGISTHLLREAG